MFPAKRKTKYNPVVFGLSIFLLVGFFVPALVFADGETSSAAGDLISKGLNLIFSPFLLAINTFLYAILTVLGWELSVAVSTLEWAVNPVSVKAMFDLPVIYTLWQMIRDFFNLFFILTLLFIAFATIFQIDSFNYKKTLGKLLLMALLVNFSFPIARFIVDTANVPMYFFMESMFTNQADKSAKNIVEVSLSASQIKEILIPNVSIADHLVNGSSITMNLLIAIVFSFIFFSSLLSLSIAFAIRNVVLLILVIFSAVGFAGMVIPGFRRMASMWWDKLLKNAFFGPAAMLMMLVSVKVMENLNTQGIGGIKDQINKGTIDLGVADLSRSVAAGSIVIIPIILIWLAMGVGQYIGAEGAGMARNWAMKTSLFVTGAAAMRRRYDSFRGEMKKRSDAKYNATNIGSRLGQKAGLKMDEVNAKRVGTRLESRGARHDASAAEESQKRQIAAEAANHRINDRTSASELLRQRGEAQRSGNVAHLAAVVNQMAAREDTAGNILDEDKKRINERYADVGGVKNATKTENDKALEKHRADLVYQTATEMDKAFKEGKIKLDSQSLTSLLALKDSAIRTGNYTQKMLEEMKKADPEKAKAFTDANSTALDDMEAVFKTTLNSGGTLTDAEKRTRATAHQAHLYSTGSFHSTIASDDAQKMEVLKRSDHETLAKQADANPAEFASSAVLLSQAVGAGKTASILGRMYEEGGKNIQGAVNSIKASANAMGPVIPNSQQDKEQKAAESAIKRMENDYRFNGVDLT